MVRMYLGIVAILIVSLVGCGTGTQTTEGALGIVESCPVVDVFRESMSAPNWCTDSVSKRLIFCGDNGICGGNDAPCGPGQNGPACAAGFVCTLAGNSSYYCVQ